MIRFFAIAVEAISASIEGMDLPFCSSSSWVCPHWIDISKSIGMILFLNRFSSWKSHFSSLSFFSELGNL
jgi:hypothetical protein